MEDKEIIAEFFISVREFFKKYKMKLHSTLLSINNEINIYEKINYCMPSYNQTNNIILLDKQYNIQQEIEKIDVIIKYINDITIDEVNNEIILKQLINKMLYYKEYEFPEKFKDTLIFKKIIMDKTL